MINNIDFLKKILTGLMAFICNLWGKGHFVTQVVDSSLSGITRVLHIQTSSVVNGWYISPGSLVGSSFVTAT